MKNRPYHVLAANKSISMPSRVIFVDTETTSTQISENEKRLTLKMGWACYLRRYEDGSYSKPKWLHFTDSRVFWEFVDSKLYSKTKLYLVGHNIAFDFRILDGFANAKMRGWEEMFLWDKGKVTMLTYKAENAKLQILSTTNFFGIRLKELGELVELPKLDISFDASNDEELSTYCKRDVEIIIRAWKLWIEFIESHNLGAFKNTLASQAFGAYRHRFMPYDIHIHANADVCRLERESYKGGRSECFNVGEFPKGEYYYLDVNGMYVHQMNTQKYPHKLIGSSPTASLAFLDHKINRYSVIAEIRLSTKYPVFPVRHNNVNVYPTGEFTTVLTTPEIKFAFTYCDIISIGRIAWYEQNYIFKDYTHYFHNLKIQYEIKGNKIFRTVAKLFGNALYGKFGQRDEEASKDDKPDPNAKLVSVKYKSIIDRVKRQGIKSFLINMGDFNAVTKRWTRPNGWIKPDFDRGKASESFNSFPAIPAHVTAYARLYLWELIEKAGRKNTYYCDTDALIVSRKGYLNLMSMLDNHKLGYLKLELQGDSLTIYAPKDYILGERSRTKGIRKDAIKLKDNVYQQEQFLGVAGAKRRENPDLVTIKTISKTLQRKIKTGNVQPNGWIIPFEFPMEGEK